MGEETDPLAATIASQAPVPFVFQANNNKNNEDTVDTYHLEEGLDQHPLDILTSSTSANTNVYMPDQHAYSGEASPPPSIPMGTNSRVLFGLKWTMLGILVVLGAVVAITAFVYSRGHEYTRFEEHFQEDAARLVDAYYQKNAYKIWSALSLSGSVIARANYNENESWPNVTVPEFDFQAAGHLHTSVSDSIFWAPLLESPSQSESWEAYAVKNQEVAELTPGSTAPIHNRTIADGIFHIDHGNGGFVDAPDSLVSAPIWQVSPSKAKRHLNMFDLFSVESLQTPLALVKSVSIPQMSELLDEKTADFLLGEREQSMPRSLMISPVLNERDGTKVSGFIGIEVDWISFFDGVLSEGPATRIVLRPSCSKEHTYEVSGGVARYVGEGDLHDEEYDYLKETGPFAGMIDYWFDNLREGSEKGLPAILTTNQRETLENFTNETIMANIGMCVYRIDIYPTEEYYQKFHTSIPITYACVAVVVFLGVILMFYLYDILVERRQRKVMASAAKSDAMINSLFPAVIRDRLFRNSSQHSGESINRPTRRQSFTGRAGTRSTDTSSLEDQQGSQTPKHRLTNFLKTSFPADNAFEVSGRISDDDPIAEMFTNTTVMFADIAGFTAWSSEREPSQVFKLLETIYSAFDAIARRLNVFKVETIGDCYVAVTGLPLPQEDHAVVCAQFAYQCLLAMEQLTQQLDTTLGPGTSDLGLRIGLHSGPVTAGVLRGEKSRFQLFGDTVNTASRMESTGVPGKIQASQETTDLIRRAGKHDWLSLRNETVTAKGKGELQTYWVYLGQKHEAAPSPDLYDSSPHKVKLVRALTPASELPPKKNRYSAFQHEASFRLSQMNVDDSVSSKFSGRGDRLVDWNVEVLMGFLEKLVQRRLETNPHQSRGFKAPSNDDDSGLIIDEVVPVIELPDFAAASRTRRSNRLVKMLPPIVRAQLKEFVACIASMYRDVPFHNFEHASHVTMSANKLMKRIITADDHVDSSRKPLNPAELHASTFGISSDPLAQFAVVFAALIHDVGHTGLSNAALVENKFSVAQLFGNKSVAEQNSVVVAWELLMEHRFMDLQTCIFNNEHGRHRFRQLLVNAVMATDIMDRDMLQLRKNRWERAFDHTSSDAPSVEGKQNTAPEGKHDINRKATIVIEHIIQASDVAHTFQHWHIFLKHNTRLYNELYRSFKLGYTSKDPTDGWYEGEIGFFDFYVIPLAKKLKECGVFGVSGDEYLQYAEWNRKEWERKGRAELEKMIQQREEPPESQMFC